LLSRKIPADNLSGSLGIAEITGEAARHGLITFIGWLAFLSVNLGILNLLPIPVLDGGQVVYQLIELVKGSPVSERAQLIAQQIGIAALIMLVSLTLYNDIARHLS
jgi:regulator of sigma E protease